MQSRRVRYHGLEIIIQLPLDGIYRDVLKPGEEHSDTRRRETGNYWSIKTYSIDEVIEKKVIALCKRLGISGRTFVKEEL